MSCEAVQWEEYPHNAVFHGSQHWCKAYLLGPACWVTDPCQSLYQFPHGLSLEKDVLRGQGIRYLMVSINPRGAGGYGLPLDFIFWASNCLSLCAVPSTYGEQD